MAKDFISFPDMQVPGSGFGILGDAIRKSANGAGGDQEKNTFKAIVLRSVTGQEADATETSNVMGISGVNVDPASQPPTQAYFVRIIEDSPHAYLPDPCAQGSTDISSATNNHLIQGMHTYAIDQSATPLSIGQYVVVRLEKRDFGFDTDIGWIVGCLGQKETSKLDSESDIKCRATTVFTSGDLKVELPPGGYFGITSKKFSDQPTNEPRGIVIHYTVSNTADSAIRQLAKDHLAYHYIIERNGNVIQLASPDAIVHHDAGGTNYSHIGIALVNAGYEESLAGRQGSPPLEEWISGPDPRDNSNKKWDPYPQQQTLALTQLVRNLKQQFPSIRKVQPHSDSNTQKADSGPALDNYIETLNKTLNA